MEVVRTIGQAREILRTARKKDMRIGFVPTMGYLHRGHTSLVDEAKKVSDFQVMSIFVNKIQFNDPKDFSSYPRDLERDFDYAKGAGVDMIFLPDDSEMYNNHLTSVDVATLTDNLCGAHRPGHFRGVFTVVSKLFNIIQPDVAVFGQKDIQQAISIQKMVTDLNFPVTIIIAPIIREGDGLAMSSRNKHLSSDQRTRALALSSGLKTAERLITGGETSGDTILSAVRGIIEEGRPDSIDYVSLVNYHTLQPIDAISDTCVIAVAAFFGATRLIDNMIITHDHGRPVCRF